MIHPKKKKGTVAAVPCEAITHAACDASDAVKTIKEKERKIKTSLSKSSHEKPFLGRTGLALLRNGFDVIPIYPREKYPWLADWPSYQGEKGPKRRGRASEQEVEGWINAKPDSGVGVVCSNVRAVDLDIYESDIAEDVIAFCKKNFGATVMRAGQLPKMLLVFRVPNGGPHPLMQSAAYVDRLLKDDHEDNSGLDVNRIEVLGAKQQFVAYGIHPKTGKPYNWVSTVGLEDKTVAELPVLTDEDVVALFAFFDQAAEAYGLTRVAERFEAKASDVAPLKALENAEPKIGIALDVAKEALLRLDPDPIERQAWVDIGMGLYYEFDGSEEAFRIFEEWSATGAKYNPANVRKEWASFNADLSTKPKTFGTVKQMARGKFGKYGDAYLSPDAQPWTPETAHALGIPATDLPDGHLDEFDAEDIEDGFATIDSDWPMPDLSYSSDAGSTGLPPQPPLAVMGPARKIVERVAAANSAPVDFGMSALLASVAALTEGAYRASGDWSEVPTLRFLNNGHPSVKKTPPMTAVTSALAAIQEELNSTFEARHTEWSERAKIAKMKLKKWEREAQDAINNDTSPPPQPKDSIAPPEPRPIILVIADATPEKIMERKAKQAHGFLYASNEFSGLLTKIGREDQSTHRSLIVDAYDGKHFTLDQKQHGAGALTINSLTLSMVGSIQPEKLSEAFRQANDGFLARCSIVTPNATPVTRYSGTGTFQELKAAFLRLAELPRELSKTTDVPLSADARDFAFEFHQRAVALSAQDTGFMSEWWGKAHGLCVRLALVLLACDYSFGEIDGLDKIEASHMRRAGKLVFDYLGPMTAHSINAVQEDKIVTHAKALHCLVRDMPEKFGPGKTFTVRELQNCRRAHLASAEDIRAALRTLESSDVVRRAQPTGNSKKELWEANPALWGDR